MLSEQKEDHCDWSSVNKWVVVRMRKEATISGRVLSGMSRILNFIPRVRISSRRGIRSDVYFEKINSSAMLRIGYKLARIKKKRDQILVQ